MIKQWLILLLGFFLCLLVAGCMAGDTEPSKLPQKTPSPVDTLIEQIIKQSEASEQPPERSISPPSNEDAVNEYESVSLVEDKVEHTEADKMEEPAKAEDKADTPSAVSIDVDLTTMSSTMVYAEIYNMMIDPEDYIGKTIKISGPYYTSYYEEMDQYYHYVIIEDATACCAQGLEFLWNGEHAYPEDYPEETTKIEVVGVFGSYEEQGYTYYYLATDDVKILNQ